jgi:hypothetical protein
VRVCCDGVVLFVVRRAVKLFVFSELHRAMIMMTKMALD